MPRMTVQLRSLPDTEAAVGWAGSQTIVVDRPEGKALRDKLSVMHDRHIGMLGQTSLKPEDLQAACAAMKRLERFWTRASDLAQRPAAFTPAA